MCLTGVVSDFWPPHTPPEVSRQSFKEALLMKNALVACLADAEEKYHNWETAVRQILDETEV